MDLKLNENQIEVGEVIAGGKSKRSKKHKFWYGVWEFTHRDKDGNIIWSETIENALADEGEKVMLDVYLRAATPASNFYLGLANSTPADTTTLATLSNEPPGTYGYARQQIERNNTGWPTLVLDAGDWQATSKLVTFTASGGTIGPIAVMFLTDVLSGTWGNFVAWAALSSARTLLAGESLGCKMRVKLQ